MSEALVEIDRVSKRFGDYTAVTETSFSIGQGEFLAIMGSSGCGKTTMLRMLAGLEEPSAGEIRLEGRSQKGLPPWGRDLPLVWQSLALFPFLSVLDNVGFGLKMRGVAKPERDRRSLAWLQKLELGEFASRNVMQLSGGQRQRVALARALVTEPKVLLLDEPLSALDAHLSVRMQALLRSLQRELGITFVYVTHSQTEAFSMADRVVIMSRGKVEQIGSPQAIYRHPANRFVAEFIGNVTILRGSVAEVGEQSVRLNTANGGMSVSRGNFAGSHGAQADFYVNADQIAIGDEPRHENHVRARFLSHKFIGNMVTLFLEVPGIDDDLKVILPERTYDCLGLQPGDSVVASWPAAAAHFFGGAA
ncbi:ABC transporter ATP-binding protein [Aromatoleum evansii]|uniref:ABC transporter ATP-binding protein n=1 Tax=Aromatoleum evansii TaxID=59406 RepID=UPI00145F4E39|nr:ABC transporter ATP-binding protein [Aromatoleum evansii]NMG31161.1 ATP-binding cassette domain-containing protein [Aromatoleum evansii]